MHTRKKQINKRKHRKTKHVHTNKGGRSQFDNFQKFGQSVDSFLSAFNIDELSRKNAKEYLGYKTYNRNNIFTFTLLPSTIKENQYSGVKMTKKVKNDPGVTFFDDINHDINGVNEGLGELIMGYYNVTNKNKRKGTYQKEVNIKEALRDNLPAVPESTIEDFANTRFDHVKKNV